MLLALLGLAHAVPPAPVPASPAEQPLPLLPPAVDPSAAPTELPPPSGGPLPGEEPEFLAQKLIRGPVTRKEGAPTGAEWAVRTGTGHALGVEEFARVTGDTAGQQRIHGKRKAGVWEGILLAGIGTSLEVVALGYLAGGDTTSPESEDWLWRGATFAAAGLFPIAVCTLPSRATRDRERWTSLYYSSPQADPLIDSYNAGLRQRLGLAPLSGPADRASAPAPEPSSAPVPLSAPGAEDAPALPPTDKLPEAEPASGDPR